MATWDGGDAGCDHDTSLGDGGAKQHPDYQTPFRTGKQYTHQTKRCRKCGAIRRDSGIGLEPTLDEYLENMRAVGRELWRVLRDDGTLWMNLGDCYNSRGGHTEPEGDGRANRTERQKSKGADVDGLKPKDLIGLPWRVAFAFQADGWYLRSDVIWSKPNPMPESVRDRPTRSHEYLFLLTKRARYYYDSKAIEEPLVSSDEEYLRAGKSVRENHAFGAVAGRPLGEKSFASVPSGRNRRTVWTIPTQPYRGAHFATFPEKLVEPCILAGTSPKACGVCGAPWERVTEGKRVMRHELPKDDPNYRPGRYSRKAGGEDEYANGGAQAFRVSEMTGWRPTCEHNDDTGSCLVLDPFCGSGTVGAVSRRFGRRFVGLDLSAAYLKLASERIGAVPLGMSL